MKKILIMTNSLYGGGAEKVLQTIIHNLDYSKFSVTLYSMHREKWDSNIYSDKVEYRVLFDQYSGSNTIKKVLYSFYEKMKGKLFQVLPSAIFYKLFIRGEYDVEVAFIEGESTKIIAGSRNRKSKKYAWIHTDLIQNSWTDFLYKNVLDEAEHYRHFDCIFCVSNAVKDAFTSKYHIDETKIQVQYNPVNEFEIRKKSGENCELPDSSGMILIAVGRLVKQKGYDRLLHIVKKLQDDHFEFTLFILGDGEERLVLEQYIAKYHLEKNIHILGYQDNPYKYMIRSDIMVCSSRTEGFSTVATEALILGLPIITTNCAGMKELFNDCECGVITENDEESLYDALFDLFTEQSKINVYKKMAVLRGQEFVLEKRMEEIENIFLS
ncbi:MAG: glycosyltransferase [Eubacteriales bacterium]|nr:glycosyltransferase [Eubacteriales bacterium]